MDTSDPWITFDEKGICNHCTDYLVRYSMRVEPSLQAGNSALENMFEHIRKRGGRNSSGYDAVVGISGGTDSSYVLLLAARFGLKLLAVHLDNGWDTPSALSNIYQLLKLPNIDYVSYVLDWNKFRSIQRCFIEGAVPDIELPTDIAILKSLFITAEKYKINTVISGGNVSNEGILPCAWMYNARDMRYATSIVNQNGVSSSVLDEVRYGFRNEFYHRIVRGLVCFYPLDKIMYNKTTAALELAQDLGWIPHRHKHSESVYTRFCQLIYQPRRHGFEYRRAHLSCDICMNRITRDDALAVLRQPPLTPFEERLDIAFVANKLGYSIDELMTIMASPPKWFVDYPRNRRLLDSAYNMYRFLKGKPKLSNF